MPLLLHSNPLLLLVTLIVTLVLQSIVDSSETCSNLCWKHNVELCIFINISNILREKSKGICEKSTCAIKVLTTTTLMAICIKGKVDSQHINASFVALFILRT